MIVDLIVTTLLAVLEGFISLFPAWELPASLTTFGTSIGASLGTINGIFPVVTLGVCLAAILLCWLFIIGFQALVFIYRLVPFKAT